MAAITQDTSSSPGEDNVEPTAHTVVAATNHGSWGEAVRAFGFPLGLALVVCAVSLSAYHVAFYTPPVKIATIDIEAVIEAKQLQFAEIVARPGASDADRDRALSMVDAIGPELNAAVTDLVNQCGCLLLVKAAVVGQAAVDFTEQLKTRLNVSNVDVTAVRARLRQHTLESGRSLASQSGPK